ncbi:cytochrome P450 [Roseomonas sp. BU-1]|uniref:Cytochrome P450 n=1 Tax=Falsiroseomonas selenitidurans TaxID=2716335 RepID=A0ABX1E1N5_9PROT|nr:cytochrome P450 [Falsiroseomonas selenitidurans]
MPPALQTLFEVYAPARFMLACRRRYGPVFTIQGLGTPPLVVLAAPEPVRRLFSLPSRSLSVGRGNAALAPLFGPRSLVLADGAEHQRIRRALMPGLVGAGLDGKADVVRSATLAAASALRPGDRFSALALADRATLCTILEALFGTWRAPADEALRLRLTSMFGDLGSPLKTFGVLIPGLYDRLDRIPAVRRIRSDLAAVDAMLHDRIRTARARGAPAGSLLSRLLAAREADGQPLGAATIRDQLMTVLLAGHETTSAAIAWALHHIQRRPGLRDRLVAGLARGSEDDLVAICHETLRLHPPLTGGLVRELHEPLDLGPWRLPAGTRVLAHGWLVHLDPATHEAPAEFRPERFLDRGPDRAGYLPFGGGHRQCPGQAQALLAMRTVLATLLTSLHLAPLPDRPVRAMRRGGVMVPRGGVMLRVESVLAGPGSGSPAEREACHAVGT